MKTFLFIMLALTLNANELQWVDEQIQAIKPSRSGVDKKSIEMLTDPFIFIKKESTEKNTKQSNGSNKLSPNTTTKSTTNAIVKKETSFALDAIMNDSALINGKWYKINSKIGQYTIKTVDKTSVVLSYKSKELLLTTRSKSKNVKFKNN
jgi:hypothetical protein